MAGSVGSSVAEAAVGVDDPNSDWKLVPQSHASTLPPAAGALIRTLKSAPIEETMKRYTELDREADAQQKLYRAATKRIGRIGLAAAVTGLIAVALQLFLSPLPDFLPVLVVVHVVLLIWTIADLALLARSNPRAKWLAARGAAEQLRVALFERVLASTEQPKGDELKLLPLQLAYFRRYQLDVQMRYLEGRGNQLTQPTGLFRRLKWPAVAAGIAGLAAALAMLAQVAHEYGWYVPDGAVLATRIDVTERVVLWVFPLLLISTLYVFALSQQTVSEDERNGARYLTVARNLVFLKDHAYERVRQRAEAGERAAVLKFVGLVHDLMIAEQSQWISFQGMVDQKDTVLAGRSAPGLADLFEDRFGAADRANRTP